ncbi:MAG: hypothetical protein GEU88_09375 [Solirubrobacterales bacterium]|nr:hypothetical protein [Solirubrobacterales bacterium]
MRPSIRALAAIGAILACGASAAPASAGWEEPIDLSPVGELTNGNPSVAAAPDGSFLAAWPRALPGRPTTDRVVEARWIDATGAPGPLLTLTGAAGQVINPHVAVGPGGGALVIWNRVVAPEQIAVEARRIGADGELGEPITVTPTGERALSTALAIDDSGDATVAWNNQLDDVGQADLRVRRLPADGPPGQVLTLTPADGQVEEMAVAIDPQQRPLLVWSQFGRLQAQRLSATGEPLPGVIDLTPQADTSAGPGLGIDANGVARVSWARVSQAPIVVFTRTLAADGTLGAIESVSPTDENSVAPSLAVDGTGAAALAWQDTPPGTDPITVRGGAILPGGALGPRLPLSGPSAGGSMNPRIGIDARGVATAVWQRNLDGNSGFVEAARFSSAGAQGGATMLSEPAEELPNPDVAVTAAGPALVVWGQQTPDGNGIRTQAARFVPAPPAPPSPPSAPVPPAPQPSPPPECHGERATIVGTGAHATIVGTPRRDVIDGTAGDDRIKGLGAGDLICGRAGDDEIHGNRGADRVLGGDGDDELGGGRGEDDLDGRRGEDDLGGNRRADALDGGGGEDRALGGRGEDRISGRGGEDDLHGGRADDSIFGGPKDDFLNGGRGDNRCRGGGGENVLVNCRR